MSQTESFSSLRLWTVALLASALGMLPMFLFSAGGDVYFHLSLIECFAGQFWQGDLYPRWCMQANGGLGVPVFLFYFPLPYYVTALLWPLTHLGATTLDIYHASLFAATVLTCITCQRWLSQVTTPAKALLVSVLVLFLPYRMEAMLFRAGYAEIWGMALLPLFFLSLRNLVAFKPGSRAACAGATVLLLLTHVPLAIVASVFAALYIWVMARGQQLAVALRAAYSAFWGIAMAAFYLLPAMYFRRFMAQPVDEAAGIPWANDYLTLANFKDQGRAVVGDMLGMSVMFLLGLVVLLRLKRANDKDMRGAVKAWLLASFAALFLLLPVSAPLYQALRPWSLAIFPWRMQAMFVFACAYFLAVWLECFIKPARLKTWKGDYGMLLALMVLLSFFMVGVRPDDPEMEQRIMSAHLIAEPEYRTQWTDKEHFTDEYLFGFAAKPPAQAALVSGKGTVEVANWAWNEIRIEADLPKPATLRLRHAYFPLWAAKLEDGSNLPIQPEDKTGQMLIELPAGKHTLYVDYSLLNHMPVIMIIISLLGIKGWSVCLWGVFRLRIARLALARRL